MEAFNITIIGIITVSLDVGIVIVFVFHGIWVHLHPDFNTHAFAHCVSLTAPPPPKSEGARTPIISWVSYSESQHASPISRGTSRGAHLARLISHIYRVTFIFCFDLHSLRHTFLSITRCCVTCSWRTVNWSCAPCLDESSSAWDPRLVSVK